MQTLRIRVLIPAPSYFSEIRFFIRDIYIRRENTVSSSKRHLQPITLQLSWKYQRRGKRLRKKKVCFVQSLPADSSVRFYLAGSCLRHGGRSSSFLLPWCWIDEKEGRCRRSTTHKGKGEGRSSVSSKIC